MSSYDRNDSGWGVSLAFTVFAMAFMLFILFVSDCSDRQCKDRFHCPDGTKLRPVIAGPCECISDPIENHCPESMAPCPSASASAKE